MSGPWEDYQDQPASTQPQAAAPAAQPMQQPQADGPWVDFQETAPQAAAPLTPKTSPLLDQLRQNRELTPEWNRGGSGIDMSIANEERRLATGEEPGAFGKAIGNQLLEGFGLGAKQKGTAAIDAVLEMAREGISGATSLAPGEGFSAKYESAKKIEKAKSDKAAEKAGLLGDVAQFAGGIPAAAAVTGGASLLSKMVGAGSLAFGSSAVRSDEENLDQRVADAGKEALFVAGLTGVLGGGLKVLKKGAETVIKGAKGALKFGQDTGKLLSSPEVQKEVGEELINFAPKVQEAVRAAKDTVGKQLEEQVIKNADLPVDTRSAFTNIYSKLESINPKANPMRAQVKDALLNKVKEIENQLVSASKNGTQEVPFKLVHQAKQELQDLVFNQREYSDFKLVDKLAKNWLRDLNKSLTTADLKLGTGGAYTKTNEVFSGLARATPEKIRGAMLKGLSDPLNTSAHESLRKSLGSIFKISPDLQQQYIPGVQDIITNQLNNTVSKAQLVKLLTGRVPGFDFNPLNIGSAITNMGMGAANRLGALQNATGLVPGSAGLDALQTGVRGAAQQGLQQLGPMLSE